MKDELITFETAKLAKEKGFNEKVNYAYEPDGSCTSCFSYHNFGDIEPFDWNNKTTRLVKSFYSAPTQSLLQKWLRDVYGIDIDIWHNRLTNKFRLDGVYTLSRDFEFDLDEFDTYEQALEHGLQEALKLIKE